MRFFRLGLCVLLLVVMTSCAQKPALNPSPTVPDAEATAKVTQDPNSNAKIDLRVAHLARPQNLNLLKDIYIVWVETPEGRVLNLGQLVINKNRRGTSHGVTSLDELRLFITAEDSSMTGMPQHVVLSTDMFHAQGRSLWR